MVSEGALEIEASVVLISVPKAGMGGVVRCQASLKNAMHMDVTVGPDGTETVTLSVRQTPVHWLSGPRS